MACERCGRPTDGIACDRCGTIVCRLCVDGEFGFCVQCAEKAKPTNRRGDTFLL